MEFSIKQDCQITEKSMAIHHLDKKFVLNLFSLATVVGMKWGTQLSYQSSHQYYGMPSYFIV